MSTTDGAIDQKLFSDLEWIYHCLLPKTVLQMKRLQSTKFVHLSLSAQIKQHNRYSSIINNFKVMNSALILSQILICKNHQ